MAEAEGSPPPVDVLLADLQESLELLGDVEAAVLGVVRVLVVDDDVRLGELTARGLRRIGIDAEAAAGMRPLRSHEVVVFDLGVYGSLTDVEREMLCASRPVVVTGAVDSASRALAEDLGASDYLVKPVDSDALAAAINRRTAGAPQ